MSGNEKNSSWTTIFSLVNTMIGGAMLTLPLLFRTSGVLTGILVLLISGVISYKTCMLYILHMAEEEEGI
jgi:amino acid permease